jgi:hypothetical protein
MSVGDAVSGPRAKIRPGAQPGSVALMEDAQGDGALRGDGGDEFGVAAFSGDVRGVIASVGDPTRPS